MLSASNSVTNSHTKHVNVGEGFSEGSKPAAYSSKQRILLDIEVLQKRSVLAKVTTLLAKRGLQTESLQFKPLGKQNLAVIELSLLGTDGQLRGLLNDLNRVSEVKHLDHKKAD